MKKILSVLILILLTIVSCGGKHATQKDFENTILYKKEMFHH